MRKMKVGIVGCGNIAAVYFRKCQELRNLEVVSCSDLDLDRAREKAAEYGVAKVYPYAEMLADPDVEIVVNLTIPKVHAEVALAAIAAGKHTYGEKPLGIDREEGRQVIEAARKAGVRVGSAPDTFMGAGIQTCRKLIDDGAIGQPVATTAFMLGHGPEAWHPNPEFFYKRGGGPMFDMGPYYITALVNLLGAVRSVSATARISTPTRTITSEPFRGKVVTVETPTHLAGVLNFAGGAVGTLVTSFDVWAANVPIIEIYGTEGSLAVPDPNSFGGTPRLHRQGEKGWTDVELTHSHSEQSRGLGVADMAAAIEGNRAHRASGELAFHVLDVMQGYLDASASATTYTLESTVDRPAPLPQVLASDSVE